MTAQDTETTKQVKSVTIPLDKHAATDEPYKKIFKMLEFPNIAPAPMIIIPVPKKNEEAIEIQKCFLKIMFKKA